jgi:hypothetical protein
MAKHKKRKPIAEEYFASVILDQNGKEINRHGVKTTDYETDDGNAVTEKESQNIILPDKRVWSAAQAARPGKEAVFIAQCPLCLNPPRSLFRREKPSNGLTTIASMRRCCRCGEVVCSRHYVIGSDSQTRCRRCNRIFKFHKAIKCIFFRQE